MPVACQICCCLLALLGTLLQTGCGGGSDVVSLSPTEQDFGRVLYGSTRTRSFALTNSSARTVAVQVKVNCGCFAVGSNVPPALAPGESAEISVLYSSAAVAVGPVRGKFLTITTDHPDAAELIAPLKAESYMAYEVTPSEIDLGRLDGRPESYATRRVTLRPLAGHTIQIERLLAQPSDAFDLQHGETDGVLWLDITLRRAAFRPPGSQFHAQVKVDLRLTAPGGSTESIGTFVNLRARWALPAGNGEARIK